MDEKKTKKPIYKRWWFWVIVVLVLIIIIAAASGGGKSNVPGSTGVTNSAGPGVSQNSASPSAPAASSTGPSASASPVTGPADLQLTSGNYTAGNDFPAGEYDITAVSGSGNVSSSNIYSGGINAAMGTEEANKAAGSDLYEQKYSNIKLPGDVVLSVSGGVTVRLVSDDASTAPLKPRVQPNTQTVELGNGNFTAGKDFPAGTYDIVAVSGGGNVSSDNLFSGGINAVMGTKGESKSAGIALYEQEYKNIELPQGTALSISGVSIRLIPSK
jgi:hypothetical protein